MQDSMEEHPPLFEVTRDGDPERARAAMARHMEQAGARLRGTPG